MEVVLAKNAGFCFGVERAINLVEKEIKKEKGKHKIFTYGPIIHNDVVVKDFENKGVYSIEGIDNIKNVKGNVLVIRSHGAEKKVYEEAKKNDVIIVDATCPFVSKIHDIVAKESANGKEIIIIGDKEHPEVKGIFGWVDGKATVIKNEDEALGFETDDNSSICLVSQTTFNLSKFQSLVEIISKKGYDINVINTICSATQTRQKEAESVAKCVDKMIVIGDPKSSNTRKLFEICKKYCNDTYYIQSLKDLDTANLQETRSVGITAGASTPNNIIQEVFLNVRRKKL